MRSILPLKSNVPSLVNSKSKSSSSIPNLDGPSSDSIFPFLSLSARREEIFGVGGFWSCRRQPATRNRSSFSLSQSSGKCVGGFESNHSSSSSRPSWESSGMRGEICVCRWALVLFEYVRRTYWLGYLLMCMNTPFAELLEIPDTVCRAECYLRTFFIEIREGKQGQLHCRILVFD